MDIKAYKEKVLKSAEKAVDELIKVIEEEIITDEEGEDISADKLKNAAAAKKMAIFDCFDIIDRVESERSKLNPDSEDKKEDTPKKKLTNWAENKAN